METNNEANAIELELKDSEDDHAMNIEIFEKVEESKDDPKEVHDSSSKRKKKNSIVWTHFTIPKPEEVQRTKCKYCGKDYAYDPKKIGTSSLWNHLHTQCRKYPHSKVDKKQKTLIFESNHNGGDGSLKAIAFSNALCRKALAKMIIIDELSFRFVQKAGFKYFCRVMQPKFEVPSRVTVARDVLELYVEEKKRLKSFFSNSSQRVCLTTDTWTSIQNINYMVLTAHYIDEDWNMQKRILNFEVISNHKGETIGKMIETCLLAWGIERVTTITVDNASSNNLALAYIEKKVRNWGHAVLNCAFLHVRCCAHILNLVVADGLTEYNPSIQVIRNAVRYVRSSPSRLQKFNECVEKEKLDICGSVCLDVPTRWNSTFLMLQSALKFKRAFDRLEEDGQYFRYFIGGSYLLLDPEAHKNHDLNKIGPPVEEDWVAATNFMKFLKIFYEVTLRFSGSLYVTSNNYFHDMCLVHTHITSCMRDDNENLRRMAENMKGKYDKYWGDVKKLNPLLFIAVILDPRYKQDYVNWSIEDMYEDDFELAVSMKLKVEDALKKLFDDYRKQYSEHVKDKGVTQNDVSATDLGLQTDLKEKRLLKFKSFMQAGAKGEKSELDLYLTESKESLDNADFDVLSWWKANSSKYKTLSRLARDILAVPVSTVASESAFSTGGRVLDSFRSSLTPKTIQALICAQNWFRNDVEQEKEPIDIQAALKEISDLEGIEGDFATHVNICTDHIE